MGILGACRTLAAAALMLLALVQPASGRTVLELESPRLPVPLLDWGDAWVDPTGADAPDRVANDPSIPWQRTSPGAIYPLTTGKALWIRFTIPPAPDAERWYMEVPYPSVNRVTVYTPDSRDQWVGQSAGDTIAVANWPVPHRHPLMPLAVSAEEPRKYLVRIENPLSFGAPISFVSESYVSRHEQQTSLILGLYFGLAGLAATVSFLSAVSLRDAAHGIYGLAVTLMALTQASITGIAGLHLWPNSPAWNDLSPMVLSVLTCGALLWFCTAVVSMQERSRSLHRLILTAGALAFVVAGGIVFVNPSSRMTLMTPYIAISLSIAVVATLWAARRGDRYATWLLCGTLPVLVSTCLPLARTLGLVPSSFWTTHGMQLGIAIELPLLLVMLMLRSQDRREHNRRIHGLDRIDPATGLINEYVFRERLIRLIAVSQRLKLRSAVLLVEITNVAQVRTQFGARSADELPLRVAGRLLSIAREIDSVARLSDHRFGMLIEGPLTSEELSACGPRLVARCLMPFKGKPVELAAQVRVAQAVVPQDGVDPDLILGQLEVLLASVPSQSKRAVFNLSRQAAQSATPL